MNRRDFLLMRVRRESSLELSCEQLYMRYLDACSNGSTALLFEWLEGEIQAVKELHLRDTAWLAEENLRQQLEPLLASFRARGGRVEP